MANDEKPPDEEAAEQTPEEPSPEAQGPPSTVPSAAWAPPPPPPPPSSPADQGLAAPAAPSAAWAPSPPSRKKAAFSQFVQRTLRFPIWAVAAVAVVLLVIGGAIGSAGPSGDVERLEDDKEALERRNDRLQGEIDDRGSARAADEAETERIEAERAEAERKAAREAELEAQRAAEDEQARQQAEAEAAATAAAEAAEVERRRNNVDTGGIYAIGPDINPGQWRSGGPDSSGLCYYAILNSPDTFDIATNSISEGPSIAQLPAGKYFETSGCQPWTCTG